MEERGKYITTSDAEILQLQPGCSASWVPYTAGDPISNDVVIGGYFGDPYLGTPVVDAVNNDGRKRCGYYNPKTQLAYISEKTAQTSTEMDILVIRGYEI